MQIVISFRPCERLSIPFNYNYQLQSALYALLGEVGASDFWHDEGFRSFDASYKGFCFGRLEGKYHADIEMKQIAFDELISLELRSPSFDFIDSIQRAIERHPYIKLFDTRLDVAGASLVNRHLESGHVMMTAVTPIMVHTTLPDGHTYYYGPEDEDYTIRLCNNAARKYEAITDKKADEIKLVPQNPFKKSVTSYKGLYLTGYTGRFELNTSLKMAEFIYNTGLGEKNAQGFGFVEI